MYLNTPYLRMDEHVRPGFNVAYDPDELFSASTSLKSKSTKIKRCALDSSSTAKQNDEDNNQTDDVTDDEEDENPEKSDQDKFDDDVDHQIESNDDDDDNYDADKKEIKLSENNTIIV
ncbi:unnamed protein product [Parnassius apollo]|uniref:(apollo) hypothetical protein n=1 Tax=Parnassius apollo TaxID=110799 RepID=A0A8S3X4J0_PARAO|nr:unnamed protein product [Parnassius apollo]